MISRKLNLTAVLLVTSVFNFSPACAQVKVTEISPEGTRGDIEVIEMTVSPAGQHVPVFRHRLTYMPSETVAGNAATVYMHSLGENMLLGKWKTLQKQFGMEVYDWSGYDTPANKIPMDQMREASGFFDSYIDMHIRRASKRRNCDWGLGLEDLRGPVVYGIHLNGLQETRSISRALSLQTKLAILESRFEDAIDLMRQNYRLAVNVGQVDMLVGNLIAIAEAGITNGNMIDFIAAPDSPNMFWALSELPPIVNLRGSIRMECSALSRIFPELAAAETENHSDEEWSRIVQKLPYTISELNQIEQPPQMKLVSAAAGVMSYGPAKERLINAGFQLETVEKMAVGQVLLIDANREYRRIADMVEKEAYLPFHLSKNNDIEEFMKNEESGAFNNIGKVLSLMMMPAVQQVRQAEARIRREVDALRLIEALRMHAAETGKLPEALSEVKVVQVPRNPATDQPFQYRLDGETAVIDLPYSDGIYYSKQFKITLRK